MKIYAEITMMVAIETQETDEDTIKKIFTAALKPRWINRKSRIVNISTY